MKLGLAARGGVLLEKVFLDSFVVFGLGLGKILGSRVGFESLECGLDRFLDFFVVLGTLGSLTGSLFGGFDNRHFLPIYELINEFCLL